MPATSPLRKLARPLVLALTLAAALPPAGHAAELAATVARTTADTGGMPFDGVVEAIRQTVVAAQVPGAVVQLDVKVGDRVKAGQVLLRLDARAADQTAAASDAQVQAARAAQEVATRDFERQKQLFQQKYISQAALDRAESEFKSSLAQVKAQLAQSGASRTQSGFYVVHAPFAGVVSEVPVSLGDMAMPGRALATLYDPTALRISAAVPQSVAAQMAAGTLPRLELPGLPGAGRWVTPARVQMLPTVDPGTHTVQLRADLPAGLPGAAPGLFARLWLPVVSNGSGAPILSVATASVVRRAEMTGLYVVDPAGRPVLRQVRLGRSLGDQVEVLAGLSAGERVANDPQAAARLATGPRQTP